MALLWGRGTGAVLALVWLLCSPLTQPAAAAAAADPLLEGLTPLTDGWTFRLGDTPPWQPQSSAIPPAAFTAVNFPHQLADPWPRRPLELWYRLRLVLPPDLADPALAVGSAGINSIEVYIDGQRVGGKGRIDPEPLITPAGWVIVPLPAAARAAAGVEVALRFRAIPGLVTGFRRQGLTGLDLPPLLGQRAELRRYAEAWRYRAGLARLPWLAVLLLCLSSFVFYSSLARARRAGRESRLFAWLSLLLAIQTWASRVWDGEIFADAFFARRLGLAAIFCFFALLFRFLVHFLELEVAPLWRFLPYFLPSAALVFLLPLPPAWLLLWRDLWLVVGLAVVAAGFYYCLRALRQGRSEAGLISAGMAGVLLALTSTLAQVLFRLQLPSVIPFGFVMMIGATAIALGERFKRLADQNDQLNSNLEKQVADRTAELEEANLRLAASERQAQAASRAKGAFLANMSHEIRTPMTGVLGMTSLLMNSQLEPQQRHMLETIHSSGDSLLRILNDVLDFSKIEEDRLELDRRPFSPSACGKGVFELFQAAATAKGLSFSWHGEAAVPAAVLGDPIRVRQVLVNLVGNAIKFTTAGAVRLELRALPLSATEHRLSYRVSDTGGGISAEDLSYLFQPFSQVESDAAVRRSGTGLGLAISQRLAHLMGGEIRVESAKGRGSTFEFTLVAPLAAAAEERPEVATAAAVPPGLRILVAEDNPVNREIVELMLLRLGAAAKFVETGKAAVAAVRQEPFEVVLMDLNMPELDGLEATREIRRGETTGGARRVQIVALTANAFEEDRRRCREAGCDDFLPKPLRLEELAAALEAAARRQKNG